MTQANDGDRIIKKITMAKKLQQNKLDEAEKRKQQLEDELDSLDYMTFDEREDNAASETNKKMDGINHDLFPFLFFTVTIR